MFSLISNINFILFLFRAVDDVFYLLRLHIYTLSQFLGKNE